MDFITLIEKNLKVKTRKKYLQMQTGDVKETRAEITKARNELNYEPKVKIEEEVGIFCELSLKNKEWLLQIDGVKQ